MFSTLSAFEFQQKFSDRNSCLQYLAELKWKDGYVCKKCGVSALQKVTIHLQGAVLVVVTMNRLLRIPFSIT